MRSTSYSWPLAITLRGVMRSTPLDPLTSTSVTLSRLNAGRNSSLNVGRLHMTRYQGFSDSAASRSCNRGVNAPSHLFHLGHVGEFDDGVAFLTGLWAVGALW